MKMYLGKRVLYQRIEWIRKILIGEGNRWLPSLDDVSNANAILDPMWEREREREGGGGREIWEGDREEDQEYVHLKMNIMYEVWEIREGFARDSSLYRYRKIYKKKK